MDIKEWASLPIAEQDALASTYGITRSGKNNCIVKEEELTKIPQAVKQDEKPKEEVEEPVTKKVTKRRNRKRTSKKSKSRKSK